MRTKVSVENRKEALIQSAYRAIAQKGFVGLRLREVAADAGIDHSTLHHHFATKRDLVAAVLDYATAQFRNAPQPADKPSTLHEHLDFLGHMITERPELHRVMREFDLHAFRDSGLRAIIAQREEGWRERLMTRIDTAAENGLWPPRLDSATGAELVIALIKGASFNPKSALGVLQLFEQLLSCPKPLQTTRKKKGA